MWVPGVSVRMEPFDLDKIRMLFGDAKDVIGGVIDELSKLPSKEVAAA